MWNHFASYAKSYRILSAVEMADLIFTKHSEAFFDISLKPLVICGRNI